MVIAAVVAEVVIAAVHPEYDSGLERWGTAITDFFVAIGIVGEVSFGIWDGRIQTELRSRSNKRVETAVERAAVAERETARLNAAFGWRSLPDKNAATLVNELRHKLVTVGITHMQNDPESQNFCWQLCRMFESAGVKPGVVVCTYLGPVTFGICIAPHSRASEALQVAFKTIGIEFTVGPFPSWESAIGHERGAGDKHGRIYIGPKPMPFAPEWAS